MSESLVAREMRCALALLRVLADEVAPPRLQIGASELIVVRYSGEIPDCRYAPGHRLLVVVAPEAHAKAIEEALVDAVKENGGAQVWHWQGE